MVMFSRWRIMLCLCSVLLTQAATAAELAIKLEQDTVELGQPVWLILSSDQTAVSLDSLDFSPWQDIVVLPRTTDIALDEQHQRQTLRMKVYAYHAGQLSLPGLYFLDHRTKPLTLNVIAARDSRQHTPIDYRYHVSTLHPWQQQQVIVTCSLTMHEQYAVFNQPGPDSSHDVSVLPMQVQRSEVVQNDESRTLYKLGWVLSPTRAGNMRIQLPPIEYVRDGVVSRRFYVPALALSVAARPAWLPGTIPVGEVRVSRYAVTGPWLSTDALARVQLQLQLDGMQAEALPDYALQLRSDRTLRFYTAQQQLHTVVDSSGIHHAMQITIPLVATHIGIYRLPALRLQSFDPASGTLKTSLLAGPLILVLNRWLKALALLVSAALISWLLRKLWRYLRQQWRRYQLYRRALLQLRQAQSLDAIRQSMRTMAQAEGWSGNMTFLQWQARMQDVTSLAQQLAVSELNAAAYGQLGLEILPTVQVLTRIGRRRRLALR